MLGGEPPQHIDIGRETGLPAPDPARRDVEALEEHRPELGRRADVELAAGERVDFRHQSLEGRSELGREAGERGDVERDAGQLHLREHLGEGHLELAEETIHLVRAEALVEKRAEGVRGARSPAGRHRGRRGGLERLAEQLLRERADAVVGARGVETVRGERQIEGRARESEAAAPEGHA